MCKIDSLGLFRRFQALSDRRGDCPETGKVRVLACFCTFYAGGFRLRPRRHGTGGAAWLAAVAAMIGVVIFLMVRSDRKLKREYMIKREEI